MKTRCKLGRFLLHNEPYIVVTHSAQIKTKIRELSQVL